MLDLDLRSLIENKHIILCCGSGGVGKTTTAAALGLAAANAGRSVLVMTIDPAKRLAQAMGLDALNHEPQPIPLTADGGSLAAMMLDTKRTFDALVEKYAENDQAKAAIFETNYYQHLSSSLAGSREFMAMEKVHEVAVSGEYDLLVVDTPPAQHALEFLDAPGRLFELFEGTMVQMLLEPYRIAGRFGFNLFRKSSERILHLLENLTGYEVLADLSEFFLAFSGMFEGFKERSQRVSELLASNQTSFLLICAPEQQSLMEMNSFFARLEKDRLPLGGLIVNRVHQAEGAGDPESFRLDEAAMASLDALPDDMANGRPLRDRLLEAYREHLTLAVLDEAAIKSTDLVSRNIGVKMVPHFNRDLHNLEDLAEFAAALNGGL
jgi:anion-transporting  ArsA/GET3 family ATPase